MLDRFWDFFVDSLISAFLPLVYFYHAITGDIILNVAAEDAQGLEKVANELLIPYQYVFSGRKACLKETGFYHFEPRFPVDETFWPKMCLSFLSLPASFAFGGIAKGLSYLSPEVRERYHNLKKSYEPAYYHPNTDVYRNMGLDLKKLSELEFFVSQGQARKPGDEKHLQEEKEALRIVTEALNQALIPWWIDCGTLLGAYRYGGVIPWDVDIDIALLLPDFDHVLSALSSLDPNSYLVQDWSGRSYPKSFIKVFCRKTNAFIDLYFFKIHPEKKEVQYLFSLEGHTFFPDWFLIREKPFTAPTPFDVVFPLKKGLFDGIEVLLPQNPEKYLQMRYGENLAPTKIYNGETGRYEKDLSHPYWKN